MRQFAVAQLAFRRIIMLERPGEFMGNEDAPTSRADRRDDVRFQRIAHHHGAFGAVAMTAEDAGIRLDRLGADDLDAVKEAAQTRLGELALLVEEITLGDEHKPVAPRERLEGVGHMWQGFDRMPHEVAADLHDPAQDLAWN